MRAQRGFSLLELAVVLAILGVVLGFGINIGKNALEGSNRLSTLERLQLVKQSLEAYAERNGYLPCPAPTAVTPTSATYGMESRNAVAGSGCVAGSGVVLDAGSSSVWYGAIPFRTLGLDDGFGGDAWGNKLTYAVSASHIGNSVTGINAYAGTTGTIAIRNGTRATYTTLTTLPTGAPGAAATFAVISHGRNLRGATRVNSTAASVACGADATQIDVENCDNGNAILFDSDFNPGTQAATQFDDFIVWGTNALARNPVIALPNACPTGVCESWCATCQTSGRSSPPGTPTRVCAKFIVSTTPCEATCVWPTATLPCP